MSVNETVNPVDETAACTPAASSDAAPRARRKPISPSDTTQKARNSILTAMHTHLSAARLSLYYYPGTYIYRELAAGEVPTGSAASHPMSWHAPHPHASNSPFPRYGVPACCEVSPMHTSTKTCSPALPAKTLVPGSVLLGSTNVKHDRRRVIVALTSQQAKHAAHEAAAYVNGVEAITKRKAGAGPECPRNLIGSSASNFVCTCWMLIAW